MRCIYPAYYLQTASDMAREKPYFKVFAYDA